MHDHHLICGFGSTGRSAANALLSQGVAPHDIVAVDIDPLALEEAARAGLTAVRGDASMVAVLRQAAIDRARSVVVTPNRDDTAVLVTLTARELNPDVQIVAAGRERENLHLLRQSGADAVIDASAAVGRLLAMASRSPSAHDLVDDLLEAGHDLEVADIAPVTGPEGTLRCPPGTTIVEVVRDGRRIAYADAAVGELRPDDRLIVVRTADGSNGRRDAEGPA